MANSPFGPGSWLNRIDLSNLEVKKKKRRKVSKDGLRPSPGAKGILVLANKSGESTYFRHVQDRKEAIWLQNKMASEGWLVTVPAFKPVPKSEKPVFGRG